VAARVRQGRLRDPQDRLHPAGPRVGVWGSRLWLRTGGSETRAHNMHKNLLSRPNSIGDRAAAAFVRQENDSPRQFDSRTWRLADVVFGKHRHSQMHHSRCDCHSGELHIHHFGIPPRCDDARSSCTTQPRHRRNRPVGWPRLLGGVVLGMLFNGVKSVRLAACHPTHHQGPSTQ